MGKLNTEQVKIHRLIIFSLSLFALTVIGLYELAPTQVKAAPAHYQTPVISLSAASYPVDEGQTINVLIQLDTAPVSPTVVTIDYGTSDGSAVAGTDYTAVSGVLTFTSSSGTSQQVQIQTLQNNSSFSDSFFNFTLSNPTNATTNPDRTTAIVFINNNNATATPTPTGGTVPIFADALEPNNSFADASEITVGASATCNLTFYPPGDEDFFTWWGQAGVTYEIATSNLDAGLDTYLRIYSSNQNLLGENDDESPGSRNSKVTFTANSNNFFYARVVNTIPGDPVDKKYCISITSTVLPTNTPPPAFPSGADECEYNSTIDYACLLIINETKALTFVPTFGSDQDTDFFRIWVKPGSYITCDTEIPSGSPADTNMILFDGNGNPFNPWIGNDDKEPGNLGSRVEVFTTYTGWLFIQTGPVNVPPPEEAALHTYTLTCVQTVATPTPTPTNTAVPLPTSAGGNTGSGTVSTPTPIPTIDFPTPVATPTPINPADFIPTPIPPPIIDVNPLPTPTPVAGSGTQVVSIQVTVYYDRNINYEPELDEGIMDTAVALFDNASGELLSFGHTNETGIIRFESVQASGTVRIVVPYLNYSQIITQSNDDVTIRIAPGTLPGGIP